MKALYLSHPYRASTEYGVLQNVISAHLIAVDLWRKGHAVISPVSNCAFMGGAVLDPDSFMTGDLEILSRCDGIVMSPGWENSTGCLLEYHKAIGLGLTIYLSPEEVPDVKTN